MSWPRSARPAEARAASTPGTAQDRAQAACSGPVLRPRPPPLPQTKGVNLSCVRTCMVVAEERPRIALTQSFSKLFKDLGLPARAVSTTFGCRVNVAICLQVRGPVACVVLPPLPSSAPLMFNFQIVSLRELEGFILKDSPHSR